MQSNKLSWFKNREKDGIINLLKTRNFQPSDWALLFYSRFKNFKGKLTTCWMGPYEIEEVFENGAVKIKTIDDQPTSFIVNGHKLRFYHKPTSREESTHQVQQ